MLGIKCPPKPNGLLFITNMKMSRRFSVNKQNKNIIISLLVQEQYIIPSILTDRISDDILWTSSNHIVYAHVCKWIMTYLEIH